MYQGVKVNRIHDRGGPCPVDLPGVSRVLLMVMIILTVSGLPALAQNNPPVVENVVAVQLLDSTRLVQIDYDLSDLDGDNCTVVVRASNDGGVSWSIPAQSLSGDVGGGIVPGAGKQIIWNPWIDNLGQSGSQYMIRVCADDGHVPSDMALVPEGEYAMGCHAETGETCSSDELPVHDVYIDAFFMDIYEVTNDQYAAYLNSAYGLGLIEVIDDRVYKASDSEPYCETIASSFYSRISWNGATFGVLVGFGDHPMLVVSWYGAAAFANWRSGQEGLTPCYDLETWSCDFGAEGYRLPTEAEWEKASRGGEFDPYYTFPWGNTLSGSDANYFMSGDAYETGGYPWTTPVGDYAANAYGLHDVIGNAMEWCNDWYIEDYYSSSPYNNPQGPVSIESRVVRGGSWFETDISLNIDCASRHEYDPDYLGIYAGLRLVLAKNDCGSSGLVTIETEVVSADITCLPSSGTVPFSTQMTVNLTNLYPGQVRRLAGRIDLNLAGGAFFSSWRAGYTNVAAGGSYGSSWNNTIPALGSVIGNNIFDLITEDVTPAPYNQPPYPPAGDTDTGACTVTGVAP